MSIFLWWVNFLRLKGLNIKALAALCTCKLNLNVFYLSKFIQKHSLWDSKILSLQIWPLFSHSRLLQYSTKIMGIDFHIAHCCWGCVKCIQAEYFFNKNILLWLKYHYISRLSWHGIISSHFMGIPTQYQILFKYLFYLRLTRIQHFISLTGKDV